MADREINVNDALSMSAEAVSVAARHYLSAVQLRAAHFHAAECASLESQLEGNETFNDAHTAHALSATANAAAFLEALVNEVLVDAANSTGIYYQFFSPSHRSAIGTFWSDNKGGRSGYASTEEKAKGAVKALGIRTSFFGSTVFQDYQLLVSIRNAVTHFKPETVDIGRQISLQSRADGKFDSNRLIPAGTWFPDRCFGAGCAAWSVRTVEQAADGWTSLLGVQRAA